MVGSKRVWQLSCSVRTNLEYLSVDVLVLQALTSVELI